MNSSPDTPIYNLKAVVQETGLKPDTLRAWERRYGLPEPQRTDSGHRLYSQNDINLLKWLIVRQDEGMSISRAVDLWRRLSEEQADAAQNTVRIPQPSVSPPKPGDALAELHDAWVASCMNFDEQRAERILAQAFAIFPVEQVCTDLLQRGLQTIGEGWYHGKITVQQEHFASALATRRIETLLAATPPPTRTGRILVGCPPEEAHIFIVLLLSLLLRRKGWDIIFLGANVPVENMIMTIQTARPMLVILTAQQLATAANLADMAQVLYHEQIAVAFGGKIFTEIHDLRQRITGYYLADHLGAGIQAIEQIMAMPRPQPALKPVTATYRDALHQFQARHSWIEGDVWRSMAHTSISLDHLGKANLNFSRNIAAALTLGNIEYVGNDLLWIKGLLSNHYQMPENLVDDYLAAYLAAAKLHLEGPGNIVVDWLQDILASDDPISLTNDKQTNRRTANDER